jgi:hypothetical protein
MLAVSRRAAFAVGTALIALTTACTNPTAPAATHRSVSGTLGDGGVIVGGGTHTVKTSGGVIVGGGT